MSDLVLILIVTLYLFIAGLVCYKRSLKGYCDDDDPLTIIAEVSLAAFWPITIILDLILED